MLQEEELIGAATDDGKKTILVVEDDDDTQTFFTQALSMFTAYHIEVVRNGSDALEIVKHIKPDLFILDYRLPSMNGIELYDHLHAISKLEDIPAIIISAVTFEQVKEDIESRQLGLLEKPFDLDVFLDMIEQTVS